MRGVPLIIQTNARVIAEIIFHLDIEPNAIIKPRGIEKASVTKNILSVSPKPTRRLRVISIN
jgi:hypothetical protein